MDLEITTITCLSKYVQWFNLELVSFWLGILLAENYYFHRCFTTEIPNHSSSARRNLRSTFVQYHVTCGNVFFVTCVSIDEAYLSKIFKRTGDHRDN